MTERFHSIGSNSSYTCCICLQRSEEDLQAHNDLHAMHMECIKLWAKNHSTCPVCRANVDPSSLFSWKERIVEWLDIDIRKITLGTLLNVPSAYIGAFAANSNSFHSSSPVSGTVLTAAVAVGAMGGAINILGFESITARAKLAFINSHIIVHMIRTLY